MAFEGKDLLDGIGDHQHMALGALRAKRGESAPRSRPAGSRKSPISTSFERAAIGLWRRQRRGGAAGRARESRRNGRSRRAPRCGRDRPSRPTRSPPRTARSASARRQHRGAVELAARREVGAEVHRRRAVEPEPERLRRLPFALAHEGAGRRAPSGASRCGWRARRRRTGGTARNSRPARRAGAHARRA